ncbi:MULTISPECIES: hypothetical protein [Pseudomonas]|uniref:hypothetical protein n=1 Tax=Pseudomonas TaxID=286 RepID=UPI001FF2E57B|nr:MULTISPECIES: hypothetical protein [Pseudomonas]
MRLLKLVRTASREANILAVLATAALLFKIFVLNRYSAPFFGVYEFGVIVEAVLASVVASYVFYLLVVHVKESSDREILRPYVEKHSKRLIGECLAQVSDIAKKTGVDLDFLNFTKLDVSSAFSNISPYSQAPLIISTQSMQYANWLQYFNEHKSRSDESIRKLLDQLPFLDASLVSIITAIDDCIHFSTLRFLTNIEIRNEDLSSFSEAFFDYCLLCRQLNLHLVRIGFSPVTP